MGRRREGSVPVRRGKLECVLDQFAMWFGLAFGDDFDDIEAERNFGIVEHSKPGEGASRDLSSLESLNVFEWAPLIFVRAGFNLDKNESIAISANNIDLAAGP